MEGTIDEATFRLDVSAPADAGLNRCRVVLGAGPFLAFGFSQPVAIESDTGWGSGDEIAIKAVPVLSSPPATRPNRGAALASHDPPFPYRLRQVWIRAANLSSLSIHALESSAPSPRLRIRTSPGGGLGISWLELPMVFQLEGSTNLGATPAWQPVVPESSLVIEGRRILRVYAADRVKFFRVIHHTP